VSHTTIALARPLSLIHRERKPQHSVSPTSASFFGPERRTLNGDVQGEGCSSFPVWFSPPSTVEPRQYSALNCLHHLKIADLTASVRDSLIRKPSIFVSPPGTLEAIWGSVATFGMGATSLLDPSPLLKTPLTWNLPGEFRATHPLFGTPGNRAPRVSFGWVPSVSNTVADDR